MVPTRLGPVAAAKASLRMRQPGSVIAGTARAKDLARRALTRGSVRRLAHDGVHQGFRALSAESRRREPNPLFAGRHNQQAVSRRGLVARLRCGRQFVQPLAAMYWDQEAAASPVDNGSSMPHSENTLGLPWRA